MPFPTTNAAEELPAINQILTSCGQAPVTTLDQTNPEVAIAYATLLQVSREVQSEGWTFNKEYHYKIPTNTDKQIVIPNNIIQIKLSENSQNMTFSAVRRSGKLYDRQNHRFTWDVDELECDIIWEFDFVDLPEPIRNYITSRAATIVSGRIVGDDDQYNAYNNKKYKRRALAMEYETSQGQVHYVWTSTKIHKTTIKAINHFTLYNDNASSNSARVDDYLGGVSRQSDDKKLPGQVEECINGYPDPTFGLTKRPGFQWIGNLGTGTTYDNSKWFFISRTDTEKYIGCITPAVGGSTGAIAIWNAVTFACNITYGTGAQAYLTGARTDYDVLTIQDKSIITNKTTTVAKNT